MNYVIITPAKDEEKYIENTLRSIVQQEVLPSEWIIVDDGSKDRTKEIAESYAERHPWIKVISSNKNEERGEGAPIIKAFYVGYDNITETDWDFIVKLDADLTLPNDYFKSIIDTFKKDQKVGMAGGYCVTFIDGVKKQETHASYHIRGPIKSIQKKCWQDIGGFKAVLGWDGVDEMTAMYHGWETKNIDKEVIHHRPTNNDYNKSYLYYKLGKANYKNGGNLPLAIVRWIVKSFRKPYFKLGFSYFKGFLEAYINKIDKNVDEDLARFINKFHLKRIIKFDV